MANAIIILILIALMCIAAVRIYRTIKYGGSRCSGGGAMDKKIRVKDRNSSNYPYWYAAAVSERLRMRSIPTDSYGQR